MVCQESPCKYHSFVRRRSDANYRNLKGDRLKGAYAFKTLMKYALFTHTLLPGINIVITAWVHESRLDPISQLRAITPCTHFMQLSHGFR